MGLIFTQVQCLKFTLSHFSVNAKRAVKRAVSLCKLMLVFSLLIFTSRFVDQSHARLCRMKSTFALVTFPSAYCRTGGYAPDTISYPESSGFLVSGWAPVETLGNSKKSKFFDWLPCNDFHCFTAEILR